MIKLTSAVSFRGGLVYELRKFLVLFDRFVRLLHCVGDLVQRLSNSTLAHQLFLAALHLIVVIDVAALTLALGVHGTLVGMNAVSGHALAPILVIAVIAHAHGVEGRVFVRARCHLALLAATALHTRPWMLGSLGGRGYKCCLGAAAN